MIPFSHCDMIKLWRNSGKEDTLEKMKQPIDYAQAAVDTMMRKFKAADLPPRGHFHYHQGVFLSGVYQTFLLCGKEEYFQYGKDWVDSVIDEEGNVLDFDPGQLDDIQPGILLFPLYERTGEEKYRKALDKLVPILLDYPKNKEGGFFHKKWLPHQMWLDGLYMAGPISVQYAYLTGDRRYLDLAVEQAHLMEEKTRDPKTGLWHHAWDSSGKASWADPQTGLSPEFWGRSIGWVPVALLDELDFIKPGTAEYDSLSRMTKELLQAVIPYQSEEGRWYQVVDKGGEPGNWLENSCSCLFVSAIAKAVEKGILGKEYLDAAGRGYEGVIRSLSWNGEDLLIGDVCIGTEVGDYEHYCNRPVSINDLHGVGAFLLMCARMQQING